MPLPPKLTLPRSPIRLLRAFARDGEGATAVEFAIIAIPFFALLFAIIETALAFWASQILDTQLANATRSLYTGSFQTSNAGTTDTAKLLANLRNRMCYPDGDTTKAANVTIFNCSAVKIDVRTFQQFSGSKASNPTDGSGNWADGVGTHYTSPQSGDIVIVQAAVTFPVFVTLLNPNQSTFKDGTRLLQATVAFRTEPYQ